MSAASMPDSWQYSDTQTVDTPAPSVDHSPASSSPVDALVRPLTPATTSLRFLESGAFGPPQINTVSPRTAVSGMSIASMDLLSFLKLLPMDRLLLHEAWSVRDWPSTDWDQLLAVAHRDIHVARQNVADLTGYLCNEPGNGGRTNPDRRRLFSISLINHKHSPLTFNGLLIQSDSITFQSIAVPVQAAKSRRQLLPDRSPFYARLSITQFTGLG